MILEAVLTFHLLPRPQTVTRQNCAFPMTRALRVSANFDPAAIEEIGERWHALGIPALVKSSGVADVRVEHANLPARIRHFSTLVRTKRRRSAPVRVKNWLRSADSRKFIRSTFVR